MKSSRFWLAAPALALLAGGATANDALIALSKDPNQWVMPPSNYANWRYSELSQINKSNAKDLRPIWTFSTGVLRGHEGGPLVIGDIMYIHTPFPNNVFALDLNHNGQILWKYEPKQDPTVIPVMCCDTVNRGVAYGDGKIFLYQADTTLAALDAKTGKELWSVKNGDPKKGETGTSAPMVVKDKVIVGISGGEFGVQGSVTAYNLKDGSKAWRAYSEGPDNEILFDANTTELGKPVGKDSSLKSWQGDEWKIGGGATWGWYSYDPQLNLFYYGSGNPSTWNPVQRPGDNKWSMTIFARNPDTGVAKWVYQMTPHDQWDYDGVNEMILADINVKGQPTKALVHFDRNGFGYTLNRETGALLVAEKYDPKVNWATKVDMQTGRPQVVGQYAPGDKGEDVNYKQICPAALGSKDQQPAAFSPKTRLFYVPTNHVCMDYEPFKVSYTAGQPYVGATLSMYPPQGDNNLGNFIAWDAGAGKIVWSIPEPFSVWSGALATAGDVVFYGTLEGYLKAVDIQTGKELYRFKTPSGIIGNINTYSHGGRQYIAVLSGVGGWAGIGMAAGLTKDTDGLGAVGAYKALANYTQLGGVLTVFGLPSNPLIMLKTAGIQQDAGPPWSSLVRVFVPLALTVAALALGTGFVLAAESDNAADKPYTITNGKVDKKTYNGWRRYTESCMRCHGPDGAGSSYAPDLVDSVKRMSKDDFEDVVVNGRTNVNAANENVMPPFGEVEDVVIYLDDIWAYLKARADGVLGRGRPPRIGD